jgi:hypothetical protein
MVAARGIWITYKGYAKDVTLLRRRGSALTQKRKGRGLFKTFCYLPENRSPPATDTHAKLSFMAKGYKTRPAENQNAEKSEWDELPDIVAFFEKHKPDGPIQLNGETTIINPELFISNHLSVALQYQGSRTFIPYLHRLKKLKQLMEAYAKK